MILKKIWRGIFITSGGGWDTGGNKDLPTHGRKGKKNRKGKGDLGVLNIICGNLESEKEGWATEARQ